MSKQEIQEYLDFLYGEESGVVYLANAALVGGDIKWSRGFVPWPESREALTDAIHGQSLAGKETYVCVSLLERKPTPEERELKPLFKLTNVAVVDFDGNAPEAWDGVLKPSLRIATSEPGREHVYFRYAEPLRDRDLAENISRTLAYDFEADLSGWDCVQVLRPPGTVNYGLAKPERLGRTYDVHVEESNPYRYDPPQFRTADDFRDSIAKQLGSLPDLNEILARYTWNDQLWDLFNLEMPEARTRSDKLMSLAYLSAETGMTDEAIFTVLETVDSRWQKYYKRTDRGRRYVDIIERVRRKIPYGLSADQFSGLLGTTSAQLQLPSRSSWGAVRELSITVEWLLEGYVMKNSHIVIIGEPGVGKTQAAIRTGLALATHKPFLDWKNRTENPLKVAFYSLEMGHLLIKHFQNTMDLSEDEISQIEETYSWEFPVMELELDKQSGGRQYFIENLEEHKPDVVIIDSMSRAVSGSLTDDTVVRNFNKFISFCRNKYGITVIVLHHNRKKTDGNKQKDPDLDDIYGSRFITAEPDIVMHLKAWQEDQSNGDPVDFVQFTKVKDRLMGRSQPVFARRTDQLDFVVQPPGVMIGNASDNAPIGRGKGFKPPEDFSPFK